jgi:S-adenosylmethionine:tRNA ribosyltransferase-isomerase
MRTSDFDYELPPELIAQHPAPRRDQARMLVLHRNGDPIEHRQFVDFPDFLKAGDLVVVNNTRVIPARIRGRKADTGGQVEILLLEELYPGTWDVLLHASRRPKVGSLITLGSGCGTAVVLEDGEKGRATLRIASERPWLEVLEEIGEPPLPPYIHRPGHGAGGPPPCSEEIRPGTAGSRTPDKERYQTIYAAHSGAVAAPTAGLHFTKQTFQTLEAKGVRHAAVTLHVGLGTFRPVDAENVEEHQMEPERYTVPEGAARAIEDARARGGRIVAVGSTTVRTLETVAAEHGKIVPCEGRTSLFIRPSYEFKVVDVMLTNFHLPKSTLLMMISALAGRERVLRVYETAVKERYRFFSYGDCMLIV